MLNLRRTISWFTLICLVAVATLLFVCPMNMSMVHHRNMVSATSHDCGASSNELSLHAAESGNCMDTHLTVVEKTMGTLTNALVVLTFIAAAALVLAFLFSRKVLQECIGHVLVRSRHFYRRYRSRIRFLQEEKLLHYLTMLGSQFVVSLV